MFFGVEDMLAISSQPFPEMDVIGIAAQTATVIGVQLNRSFFYFFEDASIG
jgi:hypothetical protein